MATCPSCRAAVGNGRYCSSCGAALDDTVPPLTALLDEPGRPPRNGDGAARRDAARRGGRGRGAAGAGALAVLVVAGLVVADRVSRTPPAPAPTTTVASIAVPATTVVSAVVSTARPTTTVVDWPERARVPPGLGGTVVLGFSDLTVATLDLGSGDLRAFPGLDTPLANGLYAIGDDLVVAGDWSVDGALWALDLTDGAVRTLGASGRPIAWGRSGLVLGEPGDPAAGGRHRFVGADGEVTDIVLPPLHEPVAVAQGRVLVQVQNLIAAYDPASGTLEPVADGELIAADERHLARITCAIGRCDLVSGPWEEMARHRVGFATELSGWGAELTPDGDRLVQWRATPGNSTPDVVVVDLATGRQQALAETVAPGRGMRLPLTPDGRHTIAGGGQSVRLIPLDGGPALTVGPFPKPVMTLAVQQPAPGEPR